MFRDPVVTCTGHTFERAALEQFWATTGEGGAPRCPLTNATLTSTAVVPNWSIRQQVRGRGQSPVVRARGYFSASLGPPSHVHRLSYTRRGAF